MTGPRPPRDDLGYPVGVARPVRRVVSLVPSLTESVAVTRPGALVGATAWCTHPADLDVTRVRGTKNPDLTAITGLKPDIVLANQEENRRVDVERLRAAGVPVWVTVIRTVDEAMTSLRTMFRVALGWPEPPWLARAEQVWQEHVRTPRVRVAVPIWRDPWMVVGSATFTGDIAARLGLEQRLRRPLRTLSARQPRRSRRAPACPHRPARRALSLQCKGRARDVPWSPGSAGRRPQPDLVRALPGRCPVNAAVPAGSSPPRTAVLARSSPSGYERSGREAVGGDDGRSGHQGSMAWLENDLEPEDDKAHDQPNRSVHTFRGGPKLRRDRSCPEARAVSCRRRQRRRRLEWDRRRLRLPERCLSR